MPIYNAEEYEEAVERIKMKAAAMNIEMGECLSERAICEFEELCNITLPPAYRIFLKRVGDGCNDMFGGGCRLKALCEIERRDLSSPFMLDREWIWEDDKRPSDVIGEEIAAQVYQGEIELVDAGDCMSFNLIVSGKCRGEVWCFSDVGVQPCCERQDFLGWFELWLDNPDGVDYFKDYDYDADCGPNVL